MRLAVLSASSYTNCQKLPELPSAEVDLEILAQRLSEPDAGFVVHAFRAERRLAEAIEQVLLEVGEPIEELLFYFSGYAVSSDERGPALLLDGDRLSAFSLKRLKRVIGERCKSSLLILDTVAAFDGQQPSQEVVQTLAAALVGSETPTHVLLSSRPEAATSGRSPFTSLFELVLDWQSVKSAPLGAEGLFTAMRAEESMFSELPAVEYFPGTTGFDVLKPSGAPAGFPSVPPPSIVPSEPPPGEMFAGDGKPSGEERSQALELAKAAAAAGRYDEALAHYRTAIRAAPREADAYHGALLAFRALKRPDASWNAACVLDALGAADVNESLLASAHRPDGLLAAQGVLGESDWDKRPFSPERDTPLDALWKALGDATLAVGVETARRKRRVPALDASTEQDLEKSTTMLARTLLWSARLLGIARPKLHVLESVPGDLAVAPLAEATLLAGKSLASGLGLPELAFLWSRKLVLLRPEHQALSLFTDPGELEAFVKAALSLASPNGAPRALDADTKLFARGLKRHLRGAALQGVVQAAGAVPSSRISARLDAFRRSVDRAAGRAGLCACGNLELAVKLTERFPLAGSLATSDQVSDLFAYAVSEEYAAVRERLGVAVRSE